MIKRVLFISQIVLALAGFVIVLFQSREILQHNFTFLVFVWGGIVALGSLCIYQGEQAWSLWKITQKRGSSRLQIYLSFLFSGAAILPSVCMSIFFAIFFNIGLQSWFGKPVRSSVESAGEIAQAYLQEYKNNIRLDILKVVMVLKPHMNSFSQNSTSLAQMLNDAADALNLGEVMVFTSKKNVIAKSYLTFVLSLDDVKKEDLIRAQRGEIIVQSFHDRMRALVLLDPVSETYLFIGKIIAPKVIQYLSNTQSAIHQYQGLISQNQELKLLFSSYFGLVIFLMLITSVWGGNQTGKPSFCAYL